MADKKKVQKIAGPMEGIEVKEGESATISQDGPLQSTPLENEGKNIDERMADLLADHKKMGAR